MGWDETEVAKPDIEIDDSEFLSKEDLKNQIIALEVVDYDPEFAGKFGATAKVTCDVVVATGPEAGRFEQDTQFFGNLAVQVNKAAGGVGKKTVVKIESGVSKKGNDWWGVGDVTDEEFKAALEVAKTATAGQPDDAGSGSEAPF